MRGSLCRILYWGWGTLVPYAFGITKLPEIAAGGGKRQDDIVFSGLVFLFDAVVVVELLLVVDDGILSFLLILNVTACVLVDYMNSAYLKGYLTKGCITLASSCSREVSRIFSFRILLS